jgi:hypothetical protein
MSRLYRELTSLMPPPIPALGRSAAFNVEAARSALIRAAVSNNRVFLLLVAMICVLFVFEIVLFVVWASQPLKAAAVASASGVTLPFLLYFLRDSWRAKVQADTLLALATSLDPAIVQSVIKVFLDSAKASLAHN